jgi:hypothetical protein
MSFLVIQLFLYFILFIKDHTSFAGSKALHISICDFQGSQKDIKTVYCKLNFSNHIMKILG